MTLREISIENIVEEDKIAGDHHFLLFLVIKKMGW